MNSRKGFQIIRTQKSKREIIADKSVKLQHLISTASVNKRLHENIKNLIDLFIHV